MATNFVTTGLAAFTDADPTDLLSYALLEGQGTKNTHSFRTGVKYQTKIPYAKSQTLDMSTGSISNTSLAGSGTTTFEDITLSNTQIKVQEYYTKEQLNSTIMAGLSRGTNPDELPAKELVAKIKGQEIFNENECLIWQADTHGVSRYYKDTSTHWSKYSAGGQTGNKFDGIISQLYGTAGEIGYIPVNFVSSNYSDASILQWVGRMVTKMEKQMPALINRRTVLSMSPENFQAYERAAFGLNSTITSQTLNAARTPVTSFPCPLNANITVQSTAGLLGKGEMVLTTPENIIVVYDAVGEDEVYDFSYIGAPFFCHFLNVNYKLGVKVVDPSLCVVTRW